MKCCCCCCCLFSRDLSRGTISAKSRRDPISDQKNMFQQIILAPFQTSKDWTNDFKIDFSAGNASGHVWQHLNRVFEEFPASPAAVITKFNSNPVHIYIFVCLCACGFVLERCIMTYFAFCVSRRSRRVSSTCSDGVLTNRQVMVSVVIYVAEVDIRL